MRKTPIKHLVHKHQRKGRIIHSYNRGKGYSLKSVQTADPSHSFKSSSLRYNLAQGKDQSANIIGYRPESEKLVWMSPEMFLRLTPKAYYDDQNLERLRQKLKLGQLLDALWLDIDVNLNKVQRHEGRHRAQVAHDLSIKEIPVVLYARDGRAFASKTLLPDINNINPEWW